MCSEYEEIEPLPVHIKEKMRKELVMLLHCVSQMVQHVEFDRDVEVFRNQLLNTIAVAKDAALLLDELWLEYRKEGEV